MAWRRSDFADENKNAPPPNNDVWMIPRLIKYSHYKIIQINLKLLLRFTL